MNRRSYGTKQIARDGKAARMRATLFITRARTRPTAEMLANACNLSLAVAEQMLDPNVPLETRRAMLAAAKKARL